MTSVFAAWKSIHSDPPSPSDSTYRIYYEMANYRQISILRFLWKHLDKTLQSIILEFSKTASLAAKNVTKKTFDIFF